MSTQNPVFIGKVLKRRRTEVGKTQFQLALDSKMDRSYIGELERDEKSPSLFTIFKLAKGLGIDPGVFINEIYKESDFDRTFEKLDGMK